MGRGGAVSQLGGLRGTQEAVWSRMEEGFRGVGMELGRTEGEELGRSWEEGSEINP